jgi:hypothetical protein
MTMCADNTGHARRGGNVMKAEKEDFRQSQPEKAGLLEPLRKTNLMEPFSKDKAEVKLRALRWVVVRDIVVALRFPIVVLLAAFGLSVLEPAIARRVLAAVLTQHLGQPATVSDAGATGPTNADTQRVDKSRHATPNP